MEFEKVDSKKAIGTFYQGTINVSFDDLVRVFGEHKYINEKRCKIDVEWVLFFGNNIIATIYNWKNGKNYLGEKGLDVEDIDEWHVGGFNSKALEMVKKALIKNKIKEKKKRKKK